MLPRPLSLAPLLLFAACEGSIGDLSSGQRSQNPSDPPPSGQLGGPEFNPFGGGSATFGAVCDADGSARGRFVFTSEPAACDRHADLLQGSTAGGDAALISTGEPIRAPGRYIARGELCLEGVCAVRDFVIEVDAIGPSGAIGFWSAPVEGGTATGPLQASECAYEAFSAGSEPDLAPNLAVTEVALYQSVKVPVWSNGLDMVSDVPVVENRAGLLRVFVEPQPGYFQSSITAELTLDAGDGSAGVVRRQTREIAIASRESARGTTFEFPLAADALGPETRWSVALRGPEACSGVGQDTSRARAPEAGTESFAARKVGTLEVRLVPFRYNGDGSGRLPDTSDAQLERYREVLMGMFPVEEVLISVREPVDLDVVVTGASSTWGPVLSRLLSVRAQDAPQASVYYYGILRPSAGGGWSGTAGLGPVPNAADSSRRGAIGLGNTGFSSVRTAAHELGHAGGRSHAPCGGAGNPDPGFPYAGGGIGVWGYDILRDSLIDPESANDFMGYCGNDWISDYNYRALANRYAFVNGFPEVESSLRWVRAMYLAPDGHVHWESPVTVPRFPGETGRPIFFLDDGGGVVAKDELVPIPLDHAEGLLAWVPVAPAGATGIELDDGRRLALPSGDPLE
ncbi:MAG: hypothetical protein AAFZ18_28540 [Myxococcota bacterium]